MKRNKRKSQEFKKPFLVLNRRKLAGWAVAIFLLCAWMFVLGVLVGRDTAPVKFDVKRLMPKQADSIPDDHVQNQEQASRDPVGVKDKTKLGFYERLPEDQQDTTVPEIEKQLSDRPEKEPDVEKKASTSISKQTTPPAETKAAPPQKAISKTEQTVRKTTSSAGTQKHTGPIYTVQAASVKNAKDADHLVAKLKQKGFPAYRTLGKVPEKGIWFRVRIGKYNSRTEANKTLNKLKKLGLKPIIVKQQ